MLRPYLGSLSLAVMALSIALPINVLLDVPALGRVFLVGILISAIAFGLWPSIFASLISTVIYDLFFLPPIYSLSISSRQDVVDLICFVVVAIITSALAARVKRYAVTADERAISAEKFADFCRRLAFAVTVDAAMEEAAALLFQHLQLPVAVVLPESGMQGIVACYPSDRAPSARALDGARQAWASGARTDMTIDDTHILIVSASGIAVAIVMVGVADGALGVTDEQRRTLDPLLLQIGLVIERFSLQQRLLDARLQKEAEALRATVLTSLSHDLRAPLASIIAGSSGLELRWQTLDEAAKIDAVQTIRSEAERLDGFIGKLLDITRIEHGSVMPRIERVVLGEIVCSAADKLGPNLANHRLILDIADDLPLANADPELLLQVLVNILDNASKYSPAGSTIRVSASHDETMTRLAITDEGSGIAEGDLPRVFDRFYRVRSTAAPVPGTGLGLAICLGFMQVMRGTIEAANRADAHGMIIALSLPLSIREYSEGDMIASWPPQ
jgi:two-component system sensor histidine kinase KdpD